MTHYAPSRLWPMLLVLVALIAGAAFLQLYAETHDVRALTVAIRNDALSGNSADDAGADDDIETHRVALDETVISAEHARAREAARRGDLATAVPIYQQEIRTSPESSRLHAELGYWLLSGDRFEEAKLELSRALELDASDPRVAVHLARAHQRLGDASAAETILRQAIQRSPGNVDAKVALAVVLRRRGAVAEAIDILEGAARSGGNETRAHTLLALGRAYLTASRREQAADAFQRAIEWAPAQAELRLGAARAYLASGKREDARPAISLLTKAIDLAPDLPQLHTALGRAYELGDEREEATAHYAQALHLDPHATYARRRLLRLALAQRDFADAAAHARHLLAQAPENSEHHFLAGLVAARDGRIEDARIAYRRAIDLAAGNYPEAFYNLGLLERDAGQPEAAITAYRQALALQPTYDAARNNLALALSAAGRTDDAVAALRTLVADRPAYAPGWMNLGRLYMRDKRYDDAIGALQGAVRARPNYTEALLNLGVAYARAGHTGEAISTYRKLIAVNPRYVAARFNLGVALERAGQPRAALEAYHETLNIDPEHTTSLRRLARLESEMGRHAEAKAAYESLLDHTPGDVDARVSLARVRLALGDLAGCTRDARSALSARADDATARRLIEKCSPAPSTDTQNRP